MFGRDGEQKEACPRDARNLICIVDFTERLAAV